MRNNTQRIYERLSRGEFLSVDSTDSSIRHLYEDIEENVEDYADYFKEIGLQLESGNGYFYFSRLGEGKQTMQSMGFAECISEQDETFKVTSAFRYAEELVNMIQIANEDEVPE